MIIQEPSKIYSLMNEKVIPFGVSVELTSKCNLNCIHCYHVISHSKELSLSEIKNLLDDLADLGSMEITFTGGEPLLRSDFTAILKYAVIEKGFSIKIFSNLTLLDENTADIIASLPINCIETTMLGIDSETHDSISGVAGSFENMLTGVRYLKDRNVPVKIKTIVMKNNLPYLRKMASLAQNIGVPFKYDDGLFVESSGSRKPLALSITNRESGIIKGGRLSKKRQMITACNAAKSVMSISPDGSVFPCGPFPFPAGNIREQKLKDIWYDSEIMKTVRSLSTPDYKICNKCHYHEKCFGCISMGIGLSNGRIHPCFVSRKKLRKFL